MSSTDVVSFSKEEIARLDEYFTGTNAETAYLLGRYCGLRINECYGLKWKNIDIEKGTITIDRQMQYQEGLIKLVPLKTRNARRTMYMSPTLKAHFVELKRERDSAQEELAAQREQNQTFITDIDGKKISSLELVNSLSNGKIQTVNSMKYHSRTINSLCCLLAIISPSFCLVYSFSIVEQPRKYNCGKKKADFKHPLLLCIIIFDY